MFSVNFFGAVASCSNRAQPEGCATEEGAGLSDQIGPQRARKPGNTKSMRDCPSEAGGKNEDGDVKSPLQGKRDLCFFAEALDVFGAFLEGADVAALD